MSSFKKGIVALEVLYLLYTISKFAGHMKWPSDPLPPNKLNFVCG
jgi:hypothetical protein